MEDNTWQKLYKEVKDGQVIINWIEEEYLQSLAHLLE
jgi:hypothetical protein